MWTLLFLCGVLATHGVQGADRYMTTEAMNSTSDSPAVRCGGYLFGYSGTFYSPNYPNTYPEYSDCTWYIRADSPIVELEFSNVSIENHSTCGYDGIDIYDGSTIDSRLLGKVCGTNAATFHSTSSYLTVRFRSDNSVSLSGFRADFRVVGSCKYNCGYQVGNCSCSSRCGYFGNCCPDYDVYCPSTSPSPDTTAQPSCRYNCGGHMGSCSCRSSCQYYGECCHDYYSQCQSTTETTVDPTTAGPSCRYNCDRHMGSCSCRSSCQYYGECCHDYYSQCQSTTETTVDPTTAGPSCRYNCGGHMGSCSCRSSCQYYGECCHDYYSQCQSTTETTVDPTTAGPSCRYNCGGHMGSCSCRSSCQYYGECCHDYYSQCQSTTETTVDPTTAGPSCRYNCGGHMGSCSCRSSCQYYGECCHDYYSQCQSTTETTVDPTTAGPSCRYNCGGHMGSCSCRSSCQYYGECCHDYYSQCQSTTETTVDPTTAQPSCRYNCGGHMGSCSCRSSCQYYGECCHDYYSQCQSTTETTVDPTTAGPSCRYNCGGHMGSCSCRSSCQYYGECCHDYYSQCQSTTETTVDPTTAGPSCRYNCGGHMGSCSCRSSCQYYGNCCHDYYSYCYFTTDLTPTERPCGGFLFDSGNFSSPNHPGYYHDNAYCVWQIRSAYDQRIYLAFTFLQLENCCSCDYIAVYDGPSVGSRYLGKACNNSLSSFKSSSNYMTVLFRTDGSVVGRGFNAEFKSTLQPSDGRVDCSSDMNIVIARSYLNSLGYDSHNLYLNDPHCRPQVSSYQVVFSFPINTCGNVRQFDNGRVVYTNTLRAYASSSDEITRQSHLKLNVSCRMEQDSVSQILYHVNHSDSSSIIGTGRFNTSMAFYTSSSFYYKVTEVPYEVDLNQNLYIQVDLRKGNSSLVIFLDSCVASPSAFDFTTRPYYLVRNGCSVDNTYWAYVSGTRAYARFTFKAFKFLRATESVYIQCKVLICPASEYNSRCRRGCTKRIARDLGSRHDSETLLVGPIRLKDPEKKEEETDQQNKA